MTDPAVWVPKASGAIPSATAAAEPLDEPPGVWAGLRGFAVLPGVKGGEFGGHGLAEDDRTGGFSERHAGRIGGGAVAAVDRRTVTSRHIDRVDQVLYCDRDPVQRSARRLGVAPPGGGKHLFAIEILPSPDHGLARVDPVEIGGG